MGLEGLKILRCVLLPLSHPSLALVERRRLQGNDGAPLANAYASRSVLFTCTVHGQRVRIRSLSRQPQSSCSVVEVRKAARHAGRDPARRDWGRGFHDSEHHNEKDIDFDWVTGNFNTMSKLSR